MASVLDHRHFRETHDHLTKIHDEWMHGSTSTSSVDQGQYSGESGHTMIHPDNLPEHTTAFIGYSPSDLQGIVSGNKGNSLVQPLATGQQGNGGSGCGQGQCDKGGGHCGTGCFCCTDEQELDNCITTGQCSGGGNVGNPNSKGGGGGKGGGGKGSVHKGHSKSKHHGGGGTKAQGANALGRVPQLGNVPYTTTPAGGSSPIMIVLMLGGGGLLIYFIWHKLRKSKAEDKEMSDKGE